jgi:hypothetical protein
VASQNKAAMCGLLFDVAAEALQTIAADPKQLRARIGATLVLHTRGSAMTHHPHLHGSVPGGGLGPDGASWATCHPGFFMPVRVLSGGPEPEAATRDRLAPNPHASKAPAPK